MLTTDATFVVTRPLSFDRGQKSVVGFRREGSEKFSLSGLTESSPTKPKSLLKRVLRSGFPHIAFHHRTV